MSWEDCQEFIRRLNGRSEEQGGVYRLPTEAEWEFACRAGTTTSYCFGDDDSLLGESAWNFKKPGAGTRPVGGKRPNSWGLYDMHGNVWEWCQDWYELYGEHSVHDPQGPTTGSDRVGRGGGWLITARDCRSADRARFRPSGRDYALGFRLAFSSVVQSGQ